MSTLKDTPYKNLSEVIKKTTGNKTKNIKDWQKRTNEIWNELKKKSTSDKELHDLTHAEINILRQDHAKRKVTFFNYYLQV